MAEVERWEGVEKNPWLTWTGCGSSPGGGGGVSIGGSDLGGWRFTEMGQTEGASQGWGRGWGGGGRQWCEGQEGNTQRCLSGRRQGKRSI